MIKTEPYKTSDYLKTNEDRAAYIQVVLEEQDDELLLLAIREVIDSLGGIGQVAKNTGLARESLYRSLSKQGNPRYSTLTKVLDELGLKLNVVAK